MPFVSSPGVGFIHSEAAEVDRQLREGDGLVWTGDPSLELRVGIRSAHKRMQHPITGRWLNRGDMIAKRYEVWSHTLDGEDVLINHWKIEEFGRILFDIAGQKASFEGRKPTAEEQIDANNARIDKANTDQLRDHYGAMFEHAFSIAQERTAGRLTHRGVGGSDERADRNLAKD